MAGRQAKVQWIERFKGYADIVNVSDNPILSNDMRSIHPYIGRLEGRGGLAKYLSISTAASTSIIGLFNYRLSSGTHQLIRLLRNGVEKISGGVWTSIEGTALTTVPETTQPQSTIIDDTLIFTNSTDQPQKYIGSGTTAPIASATSPYGKGVIAYLGLLFIFNASLDGSFTDVTDGHRLGYWADDWDSTWDSCDGNFIILDETPGAWLASAIIGRSMFCFKSDGVVKITFTPGAALTPRFQHLLIPGAVGIISPLALWAVGTAEVYYLGTNAVIYKVAENGIEPISNIMLTTLLSDTYSLDKLQFARGLIDPQKNAGYFFYDRTGLSNQLNDSYVGYNYYTKEFFPGQLGVSINAAVDFKATDRAAQQLILASPTLVENFNATAINDDGVVASRYWTSNWQKLNEVGWFHGCKIIAKRAIGVRLKVTFALDGNEDFGFARYMTLDGGRPSDTIVTIDATIPPMLAETVNIKIEIYHDSTSSISIIEKVGLLLQTINAIDERNNRGMASNKSVA